MTVDEAMSAAFELDAAIAAEEQARKHLREVESKIDAEMRAARDEIDKRHAASRAEAERAVSKAYRATLEARERLPPHPWTGKKVQRKRSIYRSWRVSDEVIDFGTVEMCKITTDFPENLSHYSLPKIGKPFVRLLKKDGTAGRKIDSSLVNWTLCTEEDKANAEK